jgi:iron complex transport system permease protein
MRQTAFWAVAAALLVMLFIAAIAFGAVPLPLDQVAAALLGHGDTATVAIVRSLRLPRALLATFVGAALGLSGAALQGSLRNPLAEPYLLGISGGAAVGAVLATVGGVTNTVLLPLAAFSGSTAAVVVVLGVARVAGGRADPRLLLIAGVVVGAFTNAAIMVALADAPPNTVRGVLWWMMGSAADADWRHVTSLGIYLAAGAAVLLWLAPAIDVLALGEEPAAGLGLDVDPLARRIYLVASLLAAATVAVAGLVGFVGLVTPHLVRTAGIRQHRPLFAGSALAGGLLVLAADIASRTVHPPTELPLGAVTALLGVPFFLAQLARRA